MASNESRIPHAATVFGGKDAMRLLLPGCRVTQFVRHTLRTETHADQPALELNTMDDSGEDNFHTVADRIVAEELLALLETTRVTHLTSVQLPVRDALAAIPIHVKEVLTSMTTEPNPNGSGTDSQVTALLERLVLQAFDMVLRTPVTWK